MRLVSAKAEVLGTLVELKLPEGNQSVIEECFKEFKRIEEKYSRFKKNSVLSLVNSRVGVWQKGDKELIFLLKKSLEFNTKTKGFFDVTIKATLEKLGYDSKYSFRQKKEIENDFEDFIEEPIIVNEQNNEFLLHKEVDFGGLGKGFAIDSVSEILEKNSIDYYYINAGGDVFGKSGKGNEPWVVLLENPDNPEFAIGKIELNGKAIACSAPNRRKWLEYHHLINPKTKSPSNENKAVFVLADSALEADAYATGLFCAGFEESLKISKELAVEILAISNNNKIYSSNGFKAELFL